MRNGIVLLLFITMLFSCKSAKNKNSINPEISQYAKEVIDRICLIEDIKPDRRLNFHVSIEELRKEYFVFTLSLNGLVPKTYFYKTIYSGFDLYVHLNNREKAAADISALFVRCAKLAVFSTDK